MYEVKACPGGGYDVIRLGGGIRACEEPRGILRSIRCLVRLVYGPFAFVAKETPYGAGIVVSHHAALPAAQQAADEANVRLAALHLYEAVILSSKCVNQDALEIAKRRCPNWK